MLVVRNWCHQNTNCSFKSTPDQIPFVIIPNVKFSGVPVTLLTNVLFLSKRNIVYDTVADNLKVEDMCILHGS